MSIVRIACGVATLLALTAAAVVVDDDRRAIAMTLVHTTAQRLAVPAANSPYISSPVGRRLTQPTTTWDPAVVAALRALHRDRQPRSLSAAR